MKRIPVIYKGKEYFLLIQYASGYCEIVEDEENTYNRVKLVHFSEITYKQLQEN
ncbi:hypothetical protein [Bacillus sp. FJAT-29814]|uniref:hypothetical protein n=1 Tax=Bacillus sp. FJAT-29814 TaxID=1729688 RepID=UPI000B011E51|nr:hypothetical protein [Bacillus sp. FJAT-29814]